MPPRKSARAAAKAEEAPAPLTNGNAVATNGEAPAKTRNKGYKLTKATKYHAAKKAPAKLPTNMKRASPDSDGTSSVPKRKKGTEPDSSDSEVEETAPKVKRARVAKVLSEPPKPKPQGPRRTGGKKKEINALRYTEPLKVFVFGEGSSGELGLGATRKAIDVKRPRFNEMLSNHNVVRLATGGMHVVALTEDNKILTWGVNDNGALGRDTSGAEVLKDMKDGDEDSDSDDDETGGLNVKEATPTAISDEFFPEDTVFVDVAAGDSCSFALTSEGAVYGWGTFRKNEGVLGFTRTVNTARTPIYIDSLKDITDICCGTNHALALDKDGHVYAWGNGQQNQLGRRITERTLIQALEPTKVGFHEPTVRRGKKKVQAVKIACGDNHCLAIDAEDNVWGWGANNYAETGYPSNAGDDDAIVAAPRIAYSLEGKEVVGLSAGSHHNLAVTKSGEVLAWGRCDSAQTGIPSDQLNAIDDTEKLLKGENGKAKILIEPMPVPGLKDITFVACGPDHNIVISKDGKAWSWGFSANYQIGQGDEDDLPTPTLLANTAVRDTKLVWAGCGGQYSMVASIMADSA